VSFRQFLKQPKIFGTEQETDGLREFSSLGINTIQLGDTQAEEKQTTSI